MNYNEVVSSAAIEIIDLFPDIEQYDDYDEICDDIFKMVEIGIKDGKIPLSYLEHMSDEKLGHCMTIIKNAKSQLTENKMNKETARLIKEGIIDARDAKLVEDTQIITRGGSTLRQYEPTYAKMSDTDGPFDHFDPHTAANRNGISKPAVKGLPDFEYNDGGWGPIPTTGVGRRDYEAKYSKSGKLIERRVKKEVASPALKESIKEYNNIKYLRENGIINNKDLHLLEDDEYDEQWVKEYEAIKESGPKWDFYSEQVQVADELVEKLKLDYNNCMDILDNAENPEQACDGICDFYQLDEDECDDVADIILGEDVGERNRHYR